jgi:hypothetical protein
MTEVSHRIRVFVYRYKDGHPNYLLLRSAQIESFWTPLHAPLGFDEKLEVAIRRGVATEVGVPTATKVIDLKMPSRWLIGDEEIIEWNFGFQAPPRNDLNVDTTRWSAFRWAMFASAYPSLELENDRAAIMRLHTLLHAA